MRALLFAVALCGCGPELQESDATTADPEDLTESLGALAAPSPTDRIIVWQQNIEAMKAAQVPAFRLTNAMLGFTYRPDIVVLQEAWQRVLCGNYLAPGAGVSADVDNFKASTRDGALATGCRLGRAPTQGSALWQLGQGLWGGAANAAHRRPFSDTLGSHSRTGVTVIWDQRRFTFEDAFEYDDADVGCSTELESYKRLAVLLRDTRRTATQIDDVFLAVASVHYGSVCPSSNNLHVAREMQRRWGSRPLLRLLGGDFNADVDTQSATYSARRAETAKAAWYSAVLREGFVDPIRAKHPDVCGQWTYPNVQSCAAKTACSDTCGTWGNRGALQRIDYLFVSGARDFISAETDDNSALYSDHKANRISIKL